MHVHQTDEAYQNYGQVPQYGQQPLYGGPQQQVRQKPVIDTSLSSYGIQIPDIVHFSHEWKDKFDCCFCCGDRTFSSTFVVPGLGQLEFARVLKCCNIACCCCYCCCDCMKCFEHYWPLPRYELLSNNLSIKYFEGNVGKLYLQGDYIGDFAQPYKNPQDVFCGRFQSSYPQVHLEAFGYNDSLLIQPEKNACPMIFDNIWCLPCAPLGFMQTKREIEVFRTKNIKAPVRIINKRGFMAQLFYHVLPCCCITQPNYPDFEVAFDPQVNQLERVLIIAGLIHGSFFDQWSFQLQIIPSFTEYKTNYRVSTL
ncbi:hypothetical protein pb186bvf_015333 [Paramecium bursaria]